MKWIDVFDQPIPKDGVEYLTRNDLQGGIMNLVRWNNIHKIFQIKGKYIGEANAGTHWIKIPNQHQKHENIPL